MSLGNLKILASSDCMLYAQAGKIAASAYRDIAAIGITNQRETTVLWDRRTGKPIYNAIAWQCRRTTEFCETLKDHADFIRTHTGLPLDACFSGTKIRWLLDNVDIKNVDDLMFGTIDSWLIWKLTCGTVPY